MGFGFLLGLARATATRRRPRTPAHLFMPPRSAAGRLPFRHCRIHSLLRSARRR
ncbi:hypothetical protein ACP4OV_025815 [Aristida adscensionis]